MRIHLGLSLQDGSLPARTTTEIGVAYFGPRQMLQWLEQHLGLAVPTEDINHLRIEQYRQALKYYLQQSPEAFFAGSFAADDLGTAAALLSRRDELLQAGWSFDLKNTQAERLKILATIESYWSCEDLSLRLYSGEADRLTAILKAAHRIPAFLSELQLCDEQAFFPPVWQRLFSALQKKGTKVQEPVSYLPAKVHNDLSRWQAFITGATNEKPVLNGDGSLLLLRSFRETHLAAYIAKLLLGNEQLRPAILLPKGDRTLDNALHLEGLPSLGVPSASLARPSLQVLKLAPVFLWNPIDPYKIMEFVSLAVKPLDDGLAQRIAAFLAETPGLFSRRWSIMISDYFNNELPERLKYDNKSSVEQIREEYNFWFDRKRVDSRSEKVSKQDVRGIYNRLQKWAMAQAREKEAPTLLVLAAQARKIVELLDALPEQELNYLELERIVRTIYEPAPLQLRPAQAYHLPIAHHAAAVYGPVSQLLWWNFFEQEPDYFFSRWFPEELAELSAIGIKIESPDQQNQRLVSQRKRPIRYTQEQLILCQPDYCDGTSVQAHPLMGDLEAAFGEDLSAITLHIDEQHIGAAWNTAFRLPKIEMETPNPLSRPHPFLKVNTSLTPRKEETPSSLEQLLYYPYQWVFRHHIQLRQSSILSVVQDNRLLGNLAHRLLEKLLKDNWKQWSKKQLEDWMVAEIPALLAKEGATLLLYGREPEYIAFSKHMKYAAWSLISLLKQNNWEVLATEKKLEGNLGTLLLHGRADLVLKRANEYAIIDLKWRGVGRYTNILSSGEDIQLALYAKLLEPEDQWAHTAFYIIDKGRMLVRNTRAFKGIQAVQDEQGHEEIYEKLLQKLLATYQWRQEQLTLGQVELRCENTCEELEEYYGEKLMDLLEMKNANAYFDDYDVLIGLVN